MAKIDGENSLRGGLGSEIANENVDQCLSCLIVCWLDGNDLFSWDDRCRVTRIVLIRWIAGYRVRESHRNTGIWTKIIYNNITNRLTNLPKIDTRRKQIDTTNIFRIEITEKGIGAVLNIRAKKRSDRRDSLSPRTNPDGWGSTGRIDVFAKSLRVIRSEWTEIDVLSCHLIDRLDERENDRWVNEGRDWDSQDILRVWFQRRLLSADSIDRTTKRTRRTTGETKSREWSKARENHRRRISSLSIVEHLDQLDISKRSRRDDIAKEMFLFRSNEPFLPIEHI